MRKNYIKYFGVASTTLLAVAPVAAPVVQNALNATLTNKVFATDNTGTYVPMDLSAQNEYGKLLQNSIQNAEGPIRSVNGVLDRHKGTADGADPEYYQIEGNYNADTVQGLILLAEISANKYDLPKNLFLNTAGDTVQDIASSDLLKYLFTNTDGSVRTNTNGFYYDGTPALKLNDSAAPGTSVKQIYDAVRYLSSKLGNHNISDILGKSFFGDPNQASISIAVNGTSDPTRLDLYKVLKQGRITITLTAKSGRLENGSFRTAQAFMNLKNTNVLFNNNNVTLSKAVVNADGIRDNYLGTSTLEDFGLLQGNSNEPKFGLIPSISSLSTDENSGYNAYIASSGEANGVPYKYSDKSTNGSASAAIGGLDKVTGIGAYSTETLVVPEGTSLDTIINKLQKIRFNGAPSISSYSRNVDDQHMLAFDDVFSTDNSVNGWKSAMTESKIPFADLGGGPKSSTALGDLLSSGTDPKSIVAATGSYQVTGVNVTGNVYLPTKDNTGNGYTFKGSNSSNAYITGVPSTTTVNIVVYPNPDFWGKQYSIGTAPSFALFAPTTAGAVVPTFYDNGQTVKETDLPYSLQSKGLNLTVGDARYYDPASKSNSQNKLNSLFRAAFGNAVYNRQILISDEDVKTSIQPIDTNTLVKDTDFPNANYYTRRPDNNTTQAGDGVGYTVDASALDLSKAGTYPVKLTYTNSKNEHGVGVETSTLTIPVTVFGSESPAFYFVGGNDQTLKAGDSFDPMNFKVAKSLDEIKDLIANGKVNDGVDYVNNPSATGIDVTVTGNVDTNVPGTYTLTYTATNVATGQATTMTRTINVIAGSNGDGGNATPTPTPDVTDFKAVGYVNYVPGYGINVYDAPAGTYTGQKLADMSAWKISHKTTINGKTWYQVGKNQWVDGQYISFTPVSHMTKLEGFVKINYVPGYSIRVFAQADDTKPTSTMLKNGTKWRVFGSMNGYYNVGKNQWIPAKYASYNK